MKTKKQKTAFRTVRVIPRIRFATRGGEQVTDSSIMAFVIDLFHQVVYEYGRHTVVADYTDQWPQYNVYDPKGRWIGCTNAVCEASWKANCRQIIKHTLI